MKQCIICGEKHSRKSKYCSRFCDEWDKKHFEGKCGRRKRK